MDHRFVHAKHNHLAFNLRETFAWKRKKKQTVEEKLQESGAVLPRSVNVHYIKYM